MSGLIVILAAGAVLSLGWREPRAGAASFAVVCALAAVYWFVLR